MATRSRHRDEYLLYRRPKPEKSEPYPDQHRRANDPPPGISSPLPDRIHHSHTYTRFTAPLICLRSSFALFGGQHHARSHTHYTSDDQCRSFLLNILSHLLYALKYPIFIICLHPVPPGRRPGPGAYRPYIPWTPRTTPPCRLPSSPIYRRSAPAISA